MLLLFVLLNLGLWTGFGDTPVAMAQCPTAEVAETKAGAKDSLVQAPQEKVEESVKVEESGESEKVNEDGGFWQREKGTLLAIISIILGIWGVVKLPQNRRWRKNYIKRYIPADFEDHHKEKNIYIQPYFAFINRQVKNPKKKKNKSIFLRDFFIDDVFVDNSKEDKIYLLLGDTGTGKTAALVHLFIDYINSHKKKNIPFEIRIFSLRNKNVFEDINKIPFDDRASTILLLDALDENVDANDPQRGSDFVMKLDEICRQFGRIVISSRPQFFKDEKEESEKIQGRRGEELSLATRLELRPFNKQQVQLFLDHVFLYSEKAKRKRAEDILQKHEFIAIRPLVLTYIRDIVADNREIKNTLDLYDIIVEKWLERDIKKGLLRRLSPEKLKEKIIKLWNIHSDVAKYIYDNGDKSKGELSITAEEVAEIVSEHGEESDLFLKRSLLTRTGDKFHFTHKSFYEYFMAYRFFLNGREVGDMRGMYFALQLVDDLYDAYKNKLTDLKGISAIAGTYHQLGSYLQMISDFQEAEKKYHEALEIRRGLAEKNPAAYKPDVAQTLNNLAALHYDTNNLEEAEKEYRVALEIRRGLAEKNPAAYQPDVARTLYNLALLHSETNKLEEAEKEYQEALKIRRELAAKNPAAYKPYVATTLNDLAILHNRNNKPEEAEGEYQEALKIYRELAEKNPAAYLSDVAMTLFNMALFYLKKGKLDTAETLAQESWEKYKKMADEYSHVAFDSDVKYAEKLLEVIRGQRK